MSQIETNGEKGGRRVDKQRLSPDPMGRVWGCRRRPSHDINDISAKELEEGRWGGGLESHLGFSKI